MSCLVEQLKVILGPYDSNVWGSLGRDEISERVDVVRQTVWEMARLEPPAPLVATRVREFDNDGLTFREYQFSGRRGSTIDAQLITNQGADLAAPLVFFCQGRNVPPDYRPKLSAKELPTYGAHEFARAGFNTFMLDYGLVKGFDADLVGNRDEINLLGLALGLKGYSPLALVVQNVLDAMAWLKQQPWLNPDKLVLFGRSLGGQIALHAALALPDPLKVALSSSIGTYRTMCAENVCMGAAHALPGMLNFFDLPDLIAALCPRNLYIQVGIDDKTMPYEDAQPALRATQAAYLASGAPEKLTIDCISGKGHATDIPSVVAHFEDLFGWQIHQQGSRP